MTPDKNNFQFRNDRSDDAKEAIELLDKGFKGTYNYYGVFDGEPDGITIPIRDVPEITPSEALALLRDTPATTTMLQELEASKMPVDPNESEMAHLVTMTHNEAIDDAIEIVTKHTAPQPNWEEVEKLVQELTKAKWTEASLNYHPVKYNPEKDAERLRKLIGYTLDANGKPVAIQKGGEE